MIHEFGFPNKSIDFLLEYSKKTNIPLVEDSAHSLNGYYRGQKMGMFGNYGLFSLPKSFPINYGGLLFGSNLQKNEHFDQNIHLGFKNKFNYELIKLIGH